MSIRTRWAIRAVGVGLVFAATAPLTAAASATAPVLISATSTGAAANGRSGTFGLAISCDGRWVAFSSTATDLAAADTDPAPDVYVRDVGGGSTVLASANAAGQRGNGMSTRPSLSADGSRVAFLSSASNLEGADGNASPDSPDPFVKDLVTGESRVVSTSAAGVKGNGASTAVTLSADGTTVAFASTATNLDPEDSDPRPDVYVKDLSTGGLTLASVTADGTKAQPGAFGIGSLSLSADGTRVAFSTDAAFSDNDDNGVADVYVKDLTSGRLVLASAGGDGTAGDKPSMSPMLTAGGDEVVFASFASTLDPRDRDEDSDVYVKSLSTGGLSVVSTNGAGEKADGRSTTPAISGDGRVVAFSSEATNLGPQPADPPHLDVYSKDRASGEVTLAAVAADDSRADAPSENPVLSAGGSRVAFFTPATNLSARDANGLADVYLVAADTPEPCPTSTPEDPQPPQSTAAPSISGTPRQGERLTEEHGAWTNSPTGYSYEWQACDGSGGNCSPIAGATSQTYTVAARDVGHTIRVTETASNAGGAGKPATSAPTDVVQGAAPLPISPARPAPPVTAGPAAHSAAEIRMQLMRDIVPNGKAAKIRALLRKAGYAYDCTALSAGRFTITWYLVPTGEHLTRAKPVLVASGRKTFTAPGKAAMTIKLTAKGRRLLKRGRILKLTAKGSFEPTGQPAVSALKVFTLRP